MEPTKLQMFVAEVQGTAESEYMGLSKQIRYVFGLIFLLRLWLFINSFS